MKKIVLGFVMVVGLLGTASADSKGGKTCGQMMAEKADLPAKMSEVMTSVADMMDAHAKLMTGSKEAKQEAAAFTKMAKEHRDLATRFKKTSDGMKKMGDLPAAEHDMAKMKADPKVQASMKAMLQSHKDMIALMQREVAEMEKMMGGGGASK